MIALFQTHTKKITLAGITVLFLCLLVFYGYQRIQAQQITTEFLSLQQSAQHLVRLQSVTPSNTLTTSFEDHVEQSAKKHQLPLLSLTPQQQELDIALSPISFKQLISWLAELQREYNIRVTRLQISALSSPGEIQVDVLRLQPLLPDNNLG